MNIAQGTKGYVLRRPDAGEIAEAKDYWHAQITTNTEIKSLGDWNFREDLYANEFPRNTLSENEPSASQIRTWLLYVSLDQLKSVIDEIVAMLAAGTYTVMLSLTFGPDTGTDATAVPDSAANLLGKNMRGFVFRRVQTLYGNDTFAPTTYY